MSLYRILSNEMKRISKIEEMLFSGFIVMPVHKSEMISDNDLEEHEIPRVHFEFLKKDWDNEITYFGKPCGQHRAGDLGYTLSINHLYKDKFDGTFYCKGYSIH